MEVFLLCSKFGEFIKMSTLQHITILTLVGSTDDTTGVLQVVGLVRVSTVTVENEIACV